MGNASSHRDEIPADEVPYFEQLSSRACVLSFQGYRLYMEDGFDFQMSGGAISLAVFDGHSGKGSMEYARKHLLNFLAFEVQEECSDANIEKAFIGIERGLKKFNETNDLEAAKHFEADASAHAASGGGAPPPLRISSHSYAPDRSGTCAIVAMIKNGELIIANAGDCTALLIKKDGTHQVLNSIHRPNYTSIPSSEVRMCNEVVRIYGAGLCVQQNRVNGELAVTRSIGDFGYKGIHEEEARHAVTCIPSITRFPITDEFKCLYLYSDGIGDGMEADEVAQYDTATSHIQTRDKLEYLLRTSMEKSRDNATLARIDF
jgi:serine/threonine protein phosphatase PrpC